LPKLRNFHLAAKKGRGYRKFSLLFQDRPEPALVSIPSQAMSQTAAEHPHFEQMFSSLFSLYPSVSRSQFPVASHFVLVLSRILSQC
jgi:hypothetical protein